MFECASMIDMMLLGLTLSEKDVSAKLKPRSCVSNGTPVLTKEIHSVRVSSSSVKLAQHQSM